MNANYGNTPRKFTKLYHSSSTGTLADEYAYTCYIAFLDKELLILEPFSDKFLVSEYNRAYTEQPLFDRSYRGILLSKKQKISYERTFSIENGYLVFEKLKINLNTGKVE